MVTTLKAAAARTTLPLGVVKELKDRGSRAFKAANRIDCDLLIRDALWGVELSETSNALMLQRAVALHHAGELSGFDIDESELAD